MAKVCMVMADGFEEIEAVTIVDVLRRAGIEVTVLGLTGRRVMGAHRIPLEADGVLAEAPEVPWDLVVLPGGMPNAATLRDSEPLRAFLGAQASRGGRIGAICAAPIALGAAGLLEGKQATCYPGFEEGLLGASPSAERVVRDGSVLTSRGPGTAMEFALALVEELAGAETARRLEGQMLV
ncbi:MAG: DJ-1/PfpI family protein [Deltaproteobacteria bacterium]|nr:DJ-1/PfpI family protein [Deltaproteobacteria bacterium]